MSKLPPTKSPQAINDANTCSVSLRRRNSASSMYANPDEDPNYQHDPIIGRNANHGESSGQTDGGVNRVHADHSTQSSK
jgi:hypothetical protein